MTKEPNQPKKRAPAKAKPRPGTAVQPKGQHRAEEILLAARAVLVEEGYAEFTTRKIAERVGIRQSNVQYYFPTKVDLVQALFESAVANQLQGILEGARNSRLSPKRQIISTLDQVLESHNDPDASVFIRELWALSAHDKDIAEVMNYFYKQWVDAATQSLLALNPKMGLRKAQRRALIVISLIDGLSLFHGISPLDHPAVKGIEKEVREVVLALAGEN
jgi:AcrR family transcriptional regulator